MRVDVVHDVDLGRSSDVLEKVAAALLPLASKVRSVRIARILRGRKAAYLPNTIETQQEDADAATFIETLVDAIRKLAEDDTDGARRQTYRVDALGEALTATVPPVLVSETFTIERGEELEPTRGSELVAVLTTMRTTVDGLAARYLELAKAAPALIIATAATLTNLSTALATANNGHYEWEYKKVELEAQSRLRHAEIEYGAVNKRRMWDSFDAYWKDLAPFLEVAAELLGGDSGQPTEEEIDAIFGAADPDLAVLAKSFLQAKKGIERDAIKAKLQAHFDGLSNGAKVVFMQQLQQIEKSRLMAIGLWMQRNGIGQTK
jgi:hypothetical protein